MPYYVLVGKPYCRYFHQAKYVAEFLANKLPSFELKIIVKEDKDWERWLRVVNVENKWYHRGSPIVWKELIRGGVKYLIGGLSEFWEYCFDNFGIKSLLRKDEVQQIIDDYRQYYISEKRITDAAPLKKNKIIICIVGDELAYVEMIIFNILQLDDAFDNYELYIRVFQQDNIDWESCIRRLRDIPFQILFTVTISKNLKMALKDCDLLIVTGNFSRLADEEFYVWLHRNYLSMLDLANLIDSYAELHLRVIVALHGPVCFDATILAQYQKQIDSRNIVALTADIGLEMLQYTATLLDRSLKNIAGPPIWGFIGVNKLIDIEHIFERCDIYRPNQRACKEVIDSSLSQGVHKPEKRFIDYRVLEIENFWIGLRDSKVKSDTIVEKISYLPKVRALTTLIDDWYSPKGEGCVMSLGILSDGTFNIPPGLIFSVPAVVRNHNWRAMESFPLPRPDPCGLNDLFPYVEEVMSKFQKIDLSSDSQPTSTSSFLSTFL